MPKKQYILITETQEAAQNASDLETAVKNSVLLALLQRKAITQWQYEQCVARLHLSSDERMKGGTYE